MRLNSELIDLISQRMEVKKINQARLANLTGLSEAAVSKIIHGKQKTIRDDTVEQIGKVLDIDHEQMFVISQDRPSSFVRQQIKKYRSSDVYEEMFEYLKKTGRLRELEGLARGLGWTEQNPDEPEDPENPR